MAKKHKIPYYIRAKARKLFSFAGIWEEFEDEKRKKLLTYSIITTSSAPKLQNIHDRMPVILEKKNESLWLKTEKEPEIKKMLKPFENIELYEISKKVNSPSNNYPGILDPLKNTPH